METLTNQEIKKLGRPKGSSNKRKKYHLRFLDINENPTWYDYDCSTYQEVCDILKNNHNITISVDVIQNITLGRKKNTMSNLKINHC